MTTSIKKTNLGPFILSEMNKKSWSLRKTAMNIGVVPSYLSRLVNGKNDSNPKPITLDKIARGLRVDPELVYEAAGQTFIDDDFDLGNALDNNKRILNHGRPLTSKEIAVIRALLS